MEKYRVLEKEILIDHGNDDALERIVVAKQNNWKWMVVSAIGVVISINALAIGLVWNEWKRIQEVRIEFQQVEKAIKIAENQKVQNQLQDNQLKNIKIAENKKNEQHRIGQQIEKIIHVKTDIKVDAKTTSDLKKNIITASTNTAATAVKKPEKIKVAFNKNKKTTARDLIKDKIIAIQTNEKIIENKIKINQHESQKSTLAVSKKPLFETRKINKVKNKNKIAIQNQTIQNYIIKDEVLINRREDEKKLAQLSLQTVKKNKIKQKHYDDIITGTYTKASDNIIDNSAKATVQNHKKENKNVSITKIVITDQKSQERKSQESKTGQDRLKVTRKIKVKPGYNPALAMKSAKIPAETINYIVTAVEQYFKPKKFHAGASIYFEFIAKKLTAIYLPQAGSGYLHVDLQQKDNPNVRLVSKVR